ncbi:MAG TPA: TPM domain-containing protein [Myxococcus sp.]|nr:TPM domain-containing protein [Myxococcus sp.]
MRTWLCGLLLACCALGTPALAITVEQVPRPAPGRWSVDTTGSISAETLAEVDRLGASLDGFSKGQLAVVVVDTTSGRQPRDFALALFNRWGIGQEGRDDGALLFIALKDRKAEIILGNGVDGHGDQARSDALMSGRIVPAFKRGSPDSAVREGAQGLHALLEQSELNNPVASHASPGRDSELAALARREREATRRAEAEAVYEPPPPPGDAGPGWGLFAGGALGLAGAAGRAWYRRRPRKCGTCQNERVRLEEAEDDRHLDAGQRREEGLGSVDYDVWWCEPCQDALVERYGAFFTSYARCSRCDYVTADKTTRTLRSATYDRGGEVEVTKRCGHCGHVSTSRHSTPKRTRSSSSSRSSSFGGGRSSGGGSSGSW